MAIELMLQGLVETYGMLGLFLVSIFANATIFLPVPLDILILGLGAFAQTADMGMLAILAFGLVAGLGAAIGEMTAYILGLFGLRVAERAKQKEFKRFLEVRERLKNSGMLFIALASLTPFPFDLVGIAAGFIRYNPQRFFLAALAGKLVRYTLIAYAGYFGVGLVKAYFFIPS